VKILALFVTASSLFAQTTITGTFKNPDTTNLTGKVVLSLTKPTINNYCTTPTQVVAFATSTIKITSGTLGALSLIAGPCMVPTHTPTATPGTGAGAGGTIMVSGTDLQATLSIVTGTSPTPNGPIVTVVFTGGPYVPAPQCIITSPAIVSNVAFTSNTGRSIQITGIAPSMTAFNISYYCQVTPYLARVYNSSNVLLYSGNWIVPNQASADVSVLDPR